MLHIPALRLGQPYESITKVDILHHATGQPVASVSQVNSGVIGRDIRQLADDVLEEFSVAELMEMSRHAAELFMTASLPLGDTRQSFDDYIKQLSATTGMPITYCRYNASKIYNILSQIETVIHGLTRGFDLSILDVGHGSSAGGTLSFFRDGRVFGAVLPSNSPGVHSLWAPAIALKAPVMLKPGREEPWTPYRMIQAFIEAGVPKEAFGFYPTDHAGAGELLRQVDRSMLFGGSVTTDPYKDDPRVEVHGPGFSKVLFGEDTIDDWEKYIDIIAASIAANGGRSCINASGVWVPRHSQEIADALAKKLATIQALAADDPDAQIAAFANASVAKQISALIDNELKIDGAKDITQTHRGQERLIHLGKCAYLLPTIIHCDDRDHPLSNREFLFPFASVVQCPVDQMPATIGQTLVATAITDDPIFKKALMTSPLIDRLNIGAIPTYQLSWDQPHEGNLFEHLYRQRAFQVESAA